LAETFVMLKPEATKQKDSLWNAKARLDNAGLRVVETRRFQPTREMAEIHYDQHRDREFFEAIVENLCSGDVIAMRVAGSDDVIEVVRDIVGDKDPAKATDGTLRCWFGIDLTQNGVHAADSLEAALRELELWFGSLKAA